jgi:hypothetical protein
VRVKPFFLALLFSIFISSATAADKSQPSRLVQIDLELMLEQFKQARMEEFRTKMQLELLATEGSLDEQAVTRQRERLNERSDILQKLVDEIRIRAMQIEEDVAKGEAARERVETVKRPSAAAPADLRKLMAGTWQLVSFADGRVSDANVGELKFIGDRHWSVSRLKPGTGRLDYHMGGTYTLKGDEYVETVEYGTGGPIGETFTYKLTVEGDRFVQTGDGNPWSLVFKRAE